MGSYTNLVLCTRDHEALARSSVWGSNVNFQDNFKEALRGV